MSSGSDAADRFVGGVAKGDFEQVINALHPELEFSVPAGLPYGGATFHGRQGFQDYLDAMVSVLEIKRIEATPYETEGPVLTRIDVTFASRATGRELHTKMVELYTIEDGMIRGIEPFYYDTAAVAALYNER